MLLLIFRMRFWSLEARKRRKRTLKKGSQADVVSFLDWSKKTLLRRTLEVLLKMYRKSNQASITSYSFELAAHSFSQNKHFVRLAVDRIVCHWGVQHLHKSVRNL